MLKIPVPGYSPANKILHWLVAVLMLMLIWLGWYMVQLGYYDRWYYLSFQVHQWLGLSVWLAGLLMILWRFFKPPARRQQPLKPVEYWLSLVVHILLAVVVLLTPVTGLMVTMADGNPLTIGSLELSIAMDVSDGVRDFAVSSHYYLAYGGLGLVVLHALAALKHHFVDRDDTLRRMLW